MGRGFPRKAQVMVQSWPRSTVWGLSGVRKRGAWRQSFFSYGFSLALRSSTARMECRGCEHLQVPTSLEGALETHHMEF